MILVLDNRNINVSFEMGALCIRQPEQKLQRVPLNLLEQMIVYGNPVIEIPVWRALSEASIPACILSRRGSQTPAMLASGLAVRLTQRRRQYRCAEHADSAIEIARWLLMQKFAAYDLALSRLDEEQALALRQKRNELHEKLKQTDTIDALMGLEGAFAHAWFSQLAGILPKQWRFGGRNRRPPLDPFNALLSLGYTLVTNEIRQVLIAEGFDPAFGFLHQPVPGREALALDITELFRGTVDFAMWLLIDRLKPEDFSYSHEHGCRLNKQARPAFYAFWAEFREQCPYLAGETDIGTSGGERTIEFSPLPKLIRLQVGEFKEQLSALASNGNVS